MVVVVYLPEETRSGRLFPTDTSMIIKGDPEKIVARMSDKKLFARRNGSIKKYIASCTEELRMCGVMCHGYTIDERCESFLRSLAQTPFADIVEA